MVLNRIPTPHLATFAFSLSLSVPTLVQEPPMTTPTQTFADLTDCMNSSADDRQRLIGVVSLLITAGAADEALYDEAPDVILNAAKQWVVSNCGPGAWNGE